MGKKWFTAKQGVMTEKGNSMPHNRLGGVSRNELVGNEVPVYKTVSPYSGEEVAIFNICPNKIAPGVNIENIKKARQEPTHAIRSVRRK